MSEPLRTEAVTAGDMVRTACDGHRHGSARQAILAATDHPAANISSSDTQSRDWWTETAISDQSGADADPTNRERSRDTACTEGSNVRTTRRTGCAIGANHVTPAGAQCDTLRAGCDSSAPDAPPAGAQRTTTRTTAPQRNGDTTMNGGDDRTRAQYLSVPQAAGYLGTTERFMRRLVAERRIVFYKVGRHVRFSINDLEAFAQAGRVEPVTVSWHGGQVSA
ncbi:helix-turn-helix domain-containing protein [Nocardia sp. CA-120079]|uniref:helix-turn-helix domain-containing protein n=1 Tax=Nocardia sp. CA-120079 TaxID=3239974 RepID=UPI003D95182D